MRDVYTTKFPDIWLNGPVESELKVDTIQDWVGQKAEVNCEEEGRCSFKVHAHRPFQTEDESDVQFVATLEEEIATIGYYNAYPTGTKL